MHVKTQKKTSLLELLRKKQQQQENSLTIAAALSTFIVGSLWMHATNTLDVQSNLDTILSWLNDANETTNKSDLDSSLQKSVTHSELGRDLFTDTLICMAPILFIGSIIIGLLSQHKKTKKLIVADKIRKTKKVKPKPLSRQEIVDKIRREQKKKERNLVSCNPQAPEDLSLQHRQKSSPRLPSTRSNTGSTATIVKKKKGKKRARNSQRLPRSALFSHGKPARNSTKAKAASSFESKEKTSNESTEASASIEMDTTKLKLKPQKPPLKATCPIGTTSDNKNTLIGAVSLIKNTLLGDEKRENKQLLLHGSAARRLQKNRSLDDVTLSEVNDFDFFLISDTASFQDSFQHLIRFSGEHNCFANHIFTMLGSTPCYIITYPNLKIDITLISFDSNSRNRNTLSWYSGLSDNPIYKIPISRDLTNFKQLELQKTHQHQEEKENGFSWIRNGTMDSVNNEIECAMVVKRLSTVQDSDYRYHENGKSYNLVEFIQHKSGKDEFFITGLKNQCKRKLGAESYEKAFESRCPTEKLC